jgi:hypothetical protein
MCIPKLTLIDRSHGKLIGRQHITRHAVLLRICFANQRMRKAFASLRRCVLAC